jgi:hypothetical protein
MRLHSESPLIQPRQEIAGLPSNFKIIHPGGTAPQLSQLPRQTTIRHVLSHQPRRPPAPSFLPAVVNTALQRLPTHLSLRLDLKFHRKDGFRRDGHGHSGAHCEDHRGENMTGIHAAVMVY